MQLPNGTKAEAIGMELKEIKIVRYKQFFKNPLPLSEQIENACVLNLAGSLTTIVGPNNSGKTTLLKAVQLFCQAVKFGSGIYSSTEMRSLLGIEQPIFDALLHGTFTVYYQNTADSKELKLSVCLARLACICREHVNPSNAPVDVRQQQENSNEASLYVSISLPDVDIRWSPIVPCSGSCFRYWQHISLHKNDYTILENLFPQVIPFNSKSVFTGELKILFDRMPEIQNKKEDINNEIARIFPYIRINYTGELNIETLPWRERLNRMICINTNEEDTLPVLTTGVKELKEHEIVDQHVQDIGVCSEGVLQCLTLIITICCVEPRSIIIIDEPDSHVFPNAQKLLINFFHRKLKEFHSSKRFCQIIITTHSTDIMQAVELKEMRQIFMGPSSHVPMEIKSLSNTEQLLNVMSALGTSILGHDDIVRLGVHRKLLYLESREDFDFFSGIIQQVKPELLLLPFTIIYKGGRTQPDQIRELIHGFRHFIPKDYTLNIFILVDSDLRRQEKLRNEKREYDLLNADKKLKTNVYYHCWAAREWENWLLFNEELLFDMLFSDSLAHEKSIQTLRQQINQNYPGMLDIFQLNDTQMTDTTTTTHMLHSHKVEDRFVIWYREELRRHYELFLHNDLTLSQMEGSEKNDPWNSEALADEGRLFLQNAGIDNNQMKIIFGNILVPTLQSIGAQNRKLNKEEEKSHMDGKKEDSLKACQDKWLEERQISQSINLDDREIRRTLAKWIDAKKFFYQLTHSTNSKVKGKKLDLDRYWKEAFSLEPANHHYPYSRYFNKNYPHTWPDDFTNLIQMFEIFVTT